MNENKGTKWVNKETSGKYQNMKDEGGNIWFALEIQELIKDAY